MVQGGMSCIKYILFVFNFIFVLVGAGLIYGGVLIIQDESIIQTVREIIDTPTTVAISLCVLGSLIAVIAFLGCCGAIVESHCILLIFGIIVTVILALELTIAGLAFAFKADLNTITTRELKEAVSKYNWTDSSATYTVVWNQLQGSLKCCGYNSSSDWKELNPYPLDSNVLPDSCCPRPHVNDSSISHNNVWTIKQSKDSGNCREQSFYADFNRGFSTPSSQQQTGPFKAGCAQHIIDTLFKLIAPLGLTCLAIALFQILGIVFAFSLAKAARQDYQVV